LSAKTKVPNKGGNGLQPLAALVLGAAAYAFLRLNGRGQRLGATMRRDIQAIKERDPAARSNLEILTCYPGLHAVWVHRLARVMWERDIPLAPRLISEIGRLFTGIEIHPGAALGEGLFIDHGAGVVIGETSEVGENVTIYQGVTLGGTGKETGKRHPTVGNNVVIGAGSQLLGSIKVGDDAKVGAGSVVVHDVPANTTVVGNPGRPVITDGAKVGIPDIDYTHLPDPVAEAMKCLVRRVVQLENELEELRTSAPQPKASGKRSRSRWPVPADEVACDPARLDGPPEI
jgi:serine O-acetyltransferase